jgi:RNA polymerase sigma-70 factor (ECF subfamily)
VFQATFFQVHQKCRQFQDERAFRPWLYAIATHQAIDAMRKQMRHPTVSFDAQRAAGVEEEADRGTYLQLLTNHAPGPVAQLEEKERREWVRRAVQDLPPLLRVQCCSSTTRGSNTAKSRRFWAFRREH